MNSSKMTMEAETRIIDEIAAFIAAIGALVTVAAVLVGGVDVGVGALIGSVVSIVNWLALRWVVGRVGRGSVQRWGALMGLLVLKMSALTVLSWMLLMHLGVDPLGFALGMVSLVGGTLIGAFRAVRLAAGILQEGER